MILKLSGASEGWRRLVLAISVIWFLISNALYFSELGSTLRSNWDDSEPFPTWIVAWSKITLGLAPGLYEYTTFTTGSLLNKSTSTTYTFEYSIVGHTTFVAIPLILLVATAALAAWVAMGFAIGKKSVGKTD